MLGERQNSKQGRPETPKHNKQEQTTIMALSSYHSLVEQVVDMNNYQESYLGQANMAGAMASAVSPNGETYLQNVFHNVSHHCDLLKRVRTPMDLICCTRINKYADTASLERLIAQRNRDHCTRHFNMGSLFRHSLVSAYAHSSFSEACCVVDVINLCMEIKKSTSTNPNEC